MRLILLSLLPLLLLAKGPEKVATLDRDIWPYPLESRAAFDKASRHEILQFVKQMSETALSDEAQVRSVTGIENINLESVEKWQELTRERVLRNYRHAQESCDDPVGTCRSVSNWDELAALSRSYLPEKRLEPWRSASERFYRYYLYEQVRLAALFPRITSEIARLHDTEVQGFEFDDLHFLWTFDDGPDGTRTPRLARALTANGVHGVFFVLGEKLESALARNGTAEMQAFYRDQCVGSHGYIHKAHPKLDTWQESYDKTRGLILENALQGTPANTVWFRPPYGQRQSELVTHLHQLGDEVLLWNIDSQDWNRKLSEKAVHDRVLTLMLLWRSGVILFHDIHDKALPAFEALNPLQHNGTVVWEDCRALHTSKAP